METTYPQSTSSVNAQQLASLVGTLLDPGRDHQAAKREPQRWDHIIRIVQDRISAPSVEPWLQSESAPKSRHAILQGLLDLVSLNPQPLPPRAVFLRSLAQEVVTRAELLEEVASASEQRGMNIVGGYINRFVDDVCGSAFRLTWLRSVPPPPHWFHGELDGIDFLFLASQFAQGARNAFSPDLRNALGGAAVRFVQAGVSLTQSL